MPAGVNGAGKTTTLQMLSGDSLPTSGTALMSGHDIIEEQMRVRRLLGYCPQFDAHLDLLTCRETLTFYGRIKGIPAALLPMVVSQALRDFDIADYEHALAGTLSGGNKRKLSVAVALIGRPPIVFLDEPSTGVDPVARRKLWGIVSRAAVEQKGCSIILTTHVSNSRASQNADVSIPYHDNSHIAVLATNSVDTCRVWKKQRHCVPV